MRTVCDSILAYNITVATNNHSNICNFTESIACDFSYAAPVTTSQLLQSDCELIHDLLPTPMGMDLTLLKNSSSMMIYIDCCDMSKRMDKKL